MIIHNTTSTVNLIVFTILFLSIFTPLLLSCTSQESDQKFSVSPVEINWKLNSNFEPDNKLSATLTLINNGEEPLPADGWALYFTSIRILDPDSFPDDYTVSHINGYLFKLEPAEEFEPIAPGERREIEYLAQFFAIKSSDAPEGFYFVFDDESIETVESVTILPFETEEQLNRSPGDNIPVPTPEVTFEQNERLTKLERDQLMPVTPTPASYTRNEGQFRFPDVLHIYTDDAFAVNTASLGSTLMREHGVDINLTTSDKQSADIRILQADTGSESREAYTLEITPDYINLTASEKPGAFYGIQTLRSLITDRGDNGLAIDAAIIDDEPAFPYRGMHLDVSRNFHGVQDVKRLLDIMGTYKLNKFHFHLTDDEGWRIAIEELPELTEIGGRRGHTETEDEFMIPAYGSGPDPTPNNSFGSGWYSRDEYIDLLKYAAERHIEVIPEIDVPGHARAAIIAMEHRYERLNEAGDDHPDRHRLHDPEDVSSYRSIQNYTDNVINVCLESTYQFMDVVIDELIDMHNEAGAPLNVIHMGGDEVPRGTWTDSPACKDLMEKEQIENVRDLQTYFFERLIRKLEPHSITMAGWEEIAFREENDGGMTINPDFAGSSIPYVWSNIWGGGTEDRAYALANSGYDVVMSHASNFYFDMAYDKHWKEPGFYWAAMLTTEVPFSFAPFNLFMNARDDNYGNPLAEDHFDEMENLENDARDNILGLQGQLWTETVNEPGRMEYMILPRLLGLAERAWAGQPEWGDLRNRDDFERERLAAWNEFANRLGSVELPRLDRLYDEINYRIPPPGAVIRDGSLHANIALPGITIRYTLDGSEPTENSPVYSEPVELSGDETVRLAGFSKTGRAGRSILVE